jgi:hypothetical protein
MSLANNFGSESVSSGMLSESVLPHNLSVEVIVSFVRKQLPLWVADPDTPKNEAENRLNESLCGFLSIQSRSYLPLCHFMHEASQRGRRKIDFAAKPVQHILVEGHLYTKNDPIFVIEGKRLPTPGKKREREYLTGLDGETTGGVQRFKLGEHGEKLDEAAIVGYVQNNSFHYWVKTINTWIDELIVSDQHLIWRESEKLGSFHEDKQTAYLISEHSRSPGKCKSGTILLHHFWVDLGS